MGWVGRSGGDGVGHTGHGIMGAAGARWGRGGATAEFSAHVLPAALAPMGRSRGRGVGEKQPGSGGKQWQANDVEKTKLISKVIRVEKTRSR